MTEIVTNGVVNTDPNESSASASTSDSKNAPASFLDSLPDDLKAEKSLQSFKDVGSLAKSYSEINKLMGKKITDLSADELKTISSKFGAPEKPEDYGIELLGVAKDDPIMTDIAKDLHSAGLNKDQAQAVVKSLSTKIDNIMKDIDKSSLEAKESNDKAVLEAFGVRVEENLKLAERALLHFGGKEFLDMANNDVKNIAAPLLKILAKAGEAIKETNVIGKGDAGQDITKENISERIRANLADPEFMKIYTNPGHAKFQEYNELMNALYLKSV